MIALTSRETCVLNFKVTGLHQDLGEEVLRPFSLWVAEEFFRRVIFLNVAIGHEPDAVGHGLGKAHFVGDHDHRHPLLRQVLHNVQDFTDHFGVQSRCWFIEQHDLGVHREGPRNGDPLCLPTG